MAGSDYLNHLRLDYEALIAAAEFRNKAKRYALATYLHSVEEREDAERDINENLADIKHFREALASLERKGAENEENLTESKTDSESPKNGFTGIDCTTVL